MSLYTATEVSILVLLKGRWNGQGVPSAPGAEPIPGRLLEALRGERGQPDGASVSIEVPRARGSVWVPLVEEQER